MPYIPEPIMGESMSSWMFRVRITKRNHINSCLSETVIRSVALCSDSERQAKLSFDPDFDLDSPLVGIFCRVYGVTMTYVAEYFRHEVQPTISRLCATAYCYECMVSSVRTVGAPHSKVAWRYALTPICTTHGTVLYDAPIEFCGLYDITRQIFRWHSTNPVAIRLKDRRSEPAEALASLAARVQTSYMNIRENAVSAATQSKIDGYMLTLMRALLMPCAHCFYVKRDFPAVLPKNCFSTDNSWYVSFYQEVFRTSAGARATSLFLAGILLGWINEEEAGELRSINHYMVCTPRHVWAALKKDTGMLMWLKTELSRNNTDYLSLSSLQEVPRQWR